MKSGGQRYLGQEAFFNCPCRICGQQQLRHAFGFERAGHEAADGLDGVEALEEDLVDGLSDGHLDTVFFGQADDGPGGGDALDDAGDGLEDVGEFAALAELFAAGAVAAGGGEAAGGEVSDAGDAEEGFLLGAHGQSEPGDLSQAAGEQGAFGVVAGLEAVEDACGQGDDVLGGPGQFDAQEVGVGVDTEPVGGEEFLDFVRGVFVFACGADGGGQAASQLVGNRRTGDGGQGAAFGQGTVWCGVVEDVGDDLGGAEECGIFDALGHGNDGDAWGEVRGQALPNVSDVLGGDGGDDQFGVMERGDGVGGEADGLGDPTAGQVTAVLAGLDQFIHVFGVIAPDGDLDAAAFQQ